jgi:outer membrane lipoprotein-sorting protein
MATPSRIRARCAGSAVLLVLAASPTVGHAAPEAAALTLEELTRGMATTSGVVAEFREVKELAILDAPIESRGTLSFVPPDRLARITTSPTETRLIVDGGRLRYRDAAGGEAIDLSDNPVARQFVDNMIVVFNGDLAAMRARYEIELTSDDRGWRLALTPRHASVRHFISRITLAGHDRALRELVTLEADGDRTTTTFDHVEVDHTFTAAELERLFRTTDP